MSAFALFIVFLLLGYAMGSVSSAIVVCRVMRLPDPRSQGSGNPGATNVMRFGGKKASALTFIGDCLKGLIPVLLATWLIGDTSEPWAIAGAALGAFLGHLYPVYFGFKGGKGIATLVGALVGIHFWLLLIFAAIWIAIVLITDYVSLASMIGALSAAIGAFFIGLTTPVILTLFLLATLTTWRHRSNIFLLINGQERKFRQSK